jgi:hypothetical protein
VSSSARNPSGSGIAASGGCTPRTTCGARAVPSRPEPRAPTSTAPREAEFERIVEVLGAVLSEAWERLGRERVLAAR